MKHYKFDLEHYREKIEHYKSEIWVFAEVEYNIDPLALEPKVFSADAKTLIKHVIDNYNIAILYKNIDKYINADCFIKAMTDEETVEFGEELRETLSKNYKEYSEQYMKELMDFLNSPDCTIEEWLSAGALANDYKAFLIFVSNAYISSQKRKYGNGGVMKFIGNPDKLDSFITKNKALIEVIAETVLEHAEYKCSQGEESQNGNS